MTRSFPSLRILPACTVFGNAASETVHETAARKSDCLRGLIAMNMSADARIAPRSTVVLHFN